MIEKLGESLFSVVGKIGDLVRSGKAQSLSEFTAPAHHNPVFMIDQTVEVMPEAGDIISGLLNLDAAILLMAANMSVNIGEINVVSQLERLNSKRSLTASGAGTLNRLFHMESYKGGLPNVKTMKSVKSLNMESNNNKTVIEGMASGTQKHQVEHLGMSSALSLGKVLEVDWTSNGNRGTVLLTLRPAVLTAAPSAIANILAIGTNNYTFKERLHGVLSGRDDLLKDGIFARNVLVENRRARINDKSGYYIKALAQHRKNRLAGIVSLNPSVANYSAVFVISEDTARMLEVNSGINLKSFKDRQKMFEGSMGMILCVVDRQWKNCKIYLHAFEDESKVSFNQMKSTSNGQGSDVKEMLNALLLNNTPSF